MTDHKIDTFRSPTYGALDLAGLVDRAVEFIESEQNSHFRIVIGTDSELVGPQTAHFVSAVVVHHVGHGGVYFLGGVNKNRINSQVLNILRPAMPFIVMPRKIISFEKSISFFPDGNPKKTILPPPF